jgi:uncharacterized glyoxalase superfamily protein PhnB
VQVEAMSKQPFIDQLDQAITEMLENPDLSPSSRSLDASLMAMLRLGRDLRDVPRPEFKMRLQAELERQVNMIAKPVQFREGFRTVTPYVVAGNEDFMHFAKHVFGAKETERTPTSPASFHAELRIGDSMLMVGVGPNRSMPAEMIVYVPDSDQIYQRALDAGAVSIVPMTEGHGQRFGCVRDAAGNQWCISTNLGTSHIPENSNTLTACFHPEGAAKFIDFLKRAFNAEEVGRHDDAEGRVLWSNIRIGDSIVGVADPGKHEWTKPIPTMIYLYVPDADALYDQAIRAGATSIHPPKDQSYGDRSGGVTDAWGNQWYMATPAS